MAVTMLAATAVTVVLLLSASAPVAAVDCGLATPAACLQLHREGCVNTTGVCGPCLPGAVGAPGEGHTACVPADATTIEAFPNGDLWLTANGKIQFNQKGTRISLDELLDVVNIKSYVDQKIEEMRVNLTKSLASDDIVEQLEQKLEGDLSALVETIEVQSGGLCSGNYFKLWFNGELYDDHGIEYGRGINAFKLDLASIPIRVAEVKSFDTCCGGGPLNNNPDEQRTMLINWIDSLETGTVVAFAIKDEGVNALGEDGKAALERMGSGLIREITFRESWAMIGVKGAVPGSVAEDHGGDPARECPSGGRETARLRQDMFGGALARYNSEIVRAKLRQEATFIGLENRVTQNEEELDALVEIIEAQSSGWCDSNFFKMWVNGQQQTFTDVGRGINAFVVDLSSVPIKPARQEKFDTCCGSNPSPEQESQRLVDFINGLHDNAVVVFGIVDEGTGGLSAAAQDALKTMGSAKIGQVRFREGWVMIGQKGAAVGSVPESDSGDAWTTCTSPRAAADKLATERVKQTFYGGRVNNNIP